MRVATVVNCLSLLACAHAGVVSGRAGPAENPVEGSALAQTSSEQDASVAGLQIPGANLLAAAQDAPYWLADIAHQGVAAFNSNPSTYKVFRNVKDYGAKGIVYWDTLCGSIQS